MKMTLPRKLFFQYFPRAGNIKAYPKAGSTCLVIDSDPIDGPIDIDIGTISYSRCCYKEDPDFPCNICKGQVAVGAKKKREYRCVSFSHYPYIRKLSRKQVRELKLRNIVEAL